MSESNVPTIRAGDSLVLKWFNLTLQPGDMMGVKVDGKIFRKRLHEMPGDTIDICNTTVDDILITVSPIKKARLN